ncbi:NTP transferase domain-containing protein [Variovorax sp. dw_308]|uniref:nucleotidyltransferase family protein n=1 Tax=Variovorax sp. dw_308 TaxID=2721546 RepID=UPI001C44362F|nr:NTP transferase domain-containing protein [Variovorax sp. dw_308]
MTNTLPTVIVLASGRGERFVASGGSGSKLQALLAGQAVLARTLAHVQASGLPWHLEDAGHPGMGDSIAAAVRNTPDAAGWLILPGDLPLVQPSTLRQVAAALGGEAQAAQPFFRGERGHPVGFARVNRESLMALQGNLGAAPVLKALRGAGKVADIEVDDVGIVTDIDTLDALARAEALLLNP